MQKFRWALLAATVAICMAQTATELESDAVNRVAVKLACSCGCTLNSACRMEPYMCPVCKRTKTKIVALQSAGKSDQDILDAFVAENGRGVLEITPGLFGTLGPYAALALGLGGVLLVIRRYMKPRPAGNLPEVDPQVLERINKDMAKLD
jgi:cytochrome c-type biogenesis protein CcmH/NrfF